MKISQSHIQDLKRWKQHYGLRQSGFYYKPDDPTPYPVYSGLDTFKLISSQGYDLEINILHHLVQINGIVDWLTFVQCATHEGWLMTTILQKIEMPITDIYGQDYWQGVKSRIYIWFKEYMNSIK